MSILSITFHTVPNQLEHWNQYVNTELIDLVENLMEVEKYILSDIETEMLTEGKNTNLFLIFDNNEKRDDFLEIELKNIQERIESKFGKNVMIFVTKIHPIKNRW